MVHPQVNYQFAIENDKMDVEIVNLPMKNGDFNISYVNVYQRVDGCWISNGAGFLTPYEKMEDLGPHFPKMECFLMFILKILFEVISGVPPF